MNNFFFARQPIFDAEGKVWGYEALYRHIEDAEQAEIKDFDESTLKVAAGLLASPDYGFKDAFCIVNATRDFLEKGYALGLANDKLVLSIPDELLRDESILEYLSPIREQGVRIMSACKGPENLRPYPERIDMFELPYSALDAAKGNSCLPEGAAQLLVTHIETHEEMESAREAGANLFQGYFFQKPKTYSVKPLATSMVNRLKVLQLLESEEQDLNALTKAIEADVSITVRLLRLVNSPVFAFVRKIDSVRQAITLVGWDKLKNWLHLIIISDMAPSEKSKELSLASAVQAKFLELIALYMGKRDLSEKLYLLGLFSLLEPIMERTYNDIFSEISIDEAVQEALVHDRGELASWLNMARDLESGNWLKLDSMAMEIGVDMKTVSKCKLDAMAWAKNFFMTTQ